MSHDFCGNGKFCILFALKNISIMEGEYEMLAESSLYHHSAF